MTPNLLHILTCLQHEVRDGTDFKPPVALPPHNMGRIHCNYAHQLGVQLRCFKKKRREALISRACSFSFEGSRIAVSLQGCAWPLVRGWK